MHKRITIYIITFCILLSLPPLQMCFRFFKEVEIYGVNPPDKPRLTLKKWFNGRFQSAATTWFEKNSGFVGHFAKTYNQLIYHLFKEAPAGDVIVGKDHYLYMDNYVVPWQGFTVSKEKELSKFAERIKKLQDLLSKRGVTFLMVIAPSKATIYPEYIPNRFRVTGKSNQTNYDRILPYLREYNVQYVDGHQYFLQLKAESQYPLFHVAGIHWSFFGACKMSQVIQSKLSSLMQKDLVALNCEPVTMDTHPTGSDRDVAELMNLWTPELLTAFPTPHPVVSVDRKRGAYRPSVLFMGDSFCWTLLDVAGRKAFKQIDFLIYNNSLYPYPSRTKAVKWPRDRHRLRELILSKEVVILEAVEPNLNQIGYGFIEDAIAALED
jgi:SGNH hydrolase-like domain, acetyltransferase AlgX